MHKYRVSFEMYGKKMTTIVHAVSYEAAKQKVLDRVTFHKVEEVKDKNVDDINKLFGDIFNICK